jgi:hypothetical protein
MSALTDNTRLSPDDRYELASRAVMHERQSRPVHLVVFGIVVFVASLIFLAIAWQHNSNANKKLVSNSVAQINVERMIDQINTLQAAQSESTSDDEFAPIPDILTRLTRIGQQVGLENELGLPKNTAPRTEGSTRLLTYPYTVRDTSLENILQWIQTSQGQIPGLQIREMTINLNAKSWLVKVTLSRYERID